MSKFKTFLKDHIGFGAVAVLQASHLKPRRHADPAALMKKFEDRQVLIDAKRAEDDARAAFINGLTRRQRKTLDRFGGPPYGHTLTRFSVERMKEILAGEGGLK